ncbi:MAG TPA: lipase family protein [Xanthobacteraceae bacterium]|nr:lipase family protein [Xanthobacteraceae bacterium]
MATGAAKLTQFFTQTTSTPDKTFAIACLQLCEVSYLPFANIPAAVAAMPPLPGGGQWQCPWVAQDSDQSNLALVALYCTAPGTVPDLAVVTIRGTDFSITDAWGTVEQVWEDGDCTKQVPLPWAAADPARVAEGTLEGFDVICGLSANGQSLEAYLTSLVNAPANADLALVVNGHSLGGCLTTVFAPGLRAKLQPSNVPVMPVTFAAPTAGNADFAAYFQQQFPQALRYASSLDAIPKAWGDLSSLETVYQPCGQTVPDVVYAGVIGFETLMHLADVSYMQPAATTLPAACSGTAQTWYDEALYQHHPSTYMQLLGGTDIPSMPTLVMAGGTPATGAQATVGSLAAVINTVKTKI